MNRIMKILKKLDALIAKVEGVSLIIILMVMMLTAFLQVVLRNFFNTALPFGEGLTRALVLWAGFMGASLAVHQGRYINIDAFTRLLNEKQKRVARVFIYLFSIVSCWFLGWASVGFVQMEMESGTMSSLGLENWIVVLVIPITFFFLSFRFLLKTILLFMGEKLEGQEWEH